MLVAHIRVGEAFTKDRKSSAASRDGLVDMVRRVHDEILSVVGMQVYAGLECRSITRNVGVLSIGQVAEACRMVSQDVRCGVGRRKAVAGARA